MSFIGFQGLPSTKVYTKQYERDKDPFGNINVIHPLHPMRKMETVVVSSLREMEGIIHVGVDLTNLLDDLGAYYYATEETTMPKPEVDIRIEDGGLGIFRLAATTSIPVDTYKTQGISDVINGILLRRLDVLESNFWVQLFNYLGFILSPPSAPQTFREIFALSRAFLSRFVPTDSFDVLLSPKAFGAALYENLLSASENSNYTHHHIAAGTLNLVPFAGRGLSFELVSVYPSYFPSLCRRYILERYYDELSVDEAEDRNVRRITAERYLYPVMPRDYYYIHQGEFVAPIVTLRGNIAIANIATFSSPNVFSNLNYVTNIT